MNRWLFLGGTAVAGLLLYLIFKVDHPGTDRSRGLSGANLSPGISGEARWNDLAAPMLPPPGRPEPFPQNPLRGGGVRAAVPERHPLDTKATVYLDGQGPASPETGSPDGAGAPLVLSAIRSVLGGEGGLPGESIAKKAEEIRRRAGGAAPGNEKGGKVPAGSELHVVILRTVDGPGNRLPVMARLTSGTLSALHLPGGTKILGYPETLTPDGRLRIRFVRILYPGGFEAHTTGLALSGGREGVPVSVSRHRGRNMARSMAQNSLMLGGEAVDTLGWSGTNVGDLMAMQAGGNALAQAGSQMPPPDNRTSFRLDRGTRCSVMILEAFPVPEVGLGER
ncbi:MAG: hypothetical protein M0T83_01845 [Nitrospiraceae bacterium]|nr:hypothetical protein [Nitrospiraceae bacterium]